MIALIVQIVMFRNEHLGRYDGRPSSTAGFSSSGLMFSWLSALIEIEDNSVP